MAQPALQPLVTIIKRLEAATSRLEDLALAQANASSHPGASGSEGSSTSLAPSVPSAPVPEVPKSVQAFDELIIQGQVVPFVKLTESLGVAVLAQQADLVAKMFDTLRALLLQAAACAKPPANVFSSILDPLQGTVEAVVKLKNANYSSKDWYNHLATISEGAPCVGWVALEAKPAPFVAESKDAASFYGNRVIKDYKEKDPKHVAWVRAFLALIEELRKYVLEHHTTGLAWNPKGGDPTKYQAPSNSETATPAPPPPPPPPPPAASLPASVPASGPGAVFAAINQGEAITKRLRPVDKSEMTHKNPALRASGTVPSGPAEPPKRPVKPSKPASLKAKKPPKFVLEGTKWLIEYQENEKNLVIEAPEINHVVLLFNCKDTTVQIKGKVNAVSMTNCTKTSILAESVISSVSISNSPSFALQITHFAPTIQLDATDSGQIYLSKECLNTEILTAKCSSINISLPVAGEDEGVFEEKALPEMLRTVIQNGKLVTSIVEHTG